MYAGRLVEIGECDAVYAAPRHPYTEALLSAALPLHPSARRQRIVLGGEVPNPASPPAGCRFHPRCPRALAACATEEPEWRELKPGRFAACHLQLNHRGAGQRPARGWWCSRTAALTRRTRLV